MEATKSLKRKIAFSLISAAASVLITYAASLMKSRITAKKALDEKDKNLNSALKDSMDCSDPVAKY
jgi:hypothetical protein